MESKKVDVLDHGFVSLVDKMQQGVAIKTVNSARISHGKESSGYNDKDKKLVGFLWDNEHTSPFRHSYYTFHIKSPLFVFRQISKYQVGSTWRTYEVNGEEVSAEVFDHFYDTDKGCSWNEISGRYTELKEEFYIPDMFRTNIGQANKQASVDITKAGISSYTGEELSINDRWKDMFNYACKRQFMMYKDFLMDGMAKELARLILPQNIYTEAYWTVSLQGVLHFLKQRLAESAQFEIQEYARAIKSLISDDLDLLGINYEK